MQLLKSQSPTCLRKAGVSIWAKSSNPGGHRGHKKDQAVAGELSVAQLGHHVKPCSRWSYLQRRQLKTDQGRSRSGIFPNFRERSLVVLNSRLNWTHEYNNNSSKLRGDTAFDLTPLLGSTCSITRQTKVILSVRKTSTFVLWFSLLSHPIPHVVHPHLCAHPAAPCG